MGTFDPNTFLDATLTEANDTVLKPCPPGEYQAVVLDEPKFRNFPGVKDPSKNYTALDILWTIEDPAVIQATGRSPTKVRQSIMLDVTDNGQLDMSGGRNVALGKLRAAIGLNEKGKPFSFRQIQGQVAKVLVTNRVDDENIYDEVKKVARI